MLLNKFDKIIENLSKKIFFTISTILQFAFAFAIIYVSLQLFISYKEANNRIVNSLGKNELYSIQNNEDYAEKLFEKDSINEYRNFYNYLEKKYKVINAVNENFFVKEFDGIDEFRIANSPSENINEGKFFILDSIVVNDNYFENFNIKLSSGRPFDKDDYNSSDTTEDFNLILGNDYAKVFNINDDIYFYDYYTKSEKIGKVVGFLEKGQFYVEKPVAIENIKSLDRMILVPNKPIKDEHIQFDDIKQINLNNVKLYKTITESYFLDLNSSDIADLKKASDDFKFFDISIVTMKDSIKIFKEIFKQQQILYLSIFLLIIIITSISMITNIINSINDRKREFGIYFAMGATKRYIIDLVLYEIFILIFMGALLSAFIIKYLNPMTESVLSIKVYTLMWIIVLLVSMIISLIPIVKIKNTPMSELLKEE